MKPGIHFDVPATEYHADPCDTPSLSCSVALELLNATPRRAWFKHPRLSGNDVAEPTRAMDEGTVLHTLMTGKGTRAHSIPYGDFKTNAAKAARVTARKSGMIPVLEDRLVDLHNIALAARAVIELNPSIAGALRSDAASEVTMISEEAGPVTLRCRADTMLPEPGSPIYDFKFTDKIDAVHDWDRRMIYDGFDVRAAFYTRVVYELRGEVSPYVYLIVEKEPPFDVLPLQCTPEMLALGEDKVEAAIGIWVDCMKADRWPGHPPRIHHISPPGWALPQWEDRKSLARFEKRKERPTRDALRASQRTYDGIRDLVDR